MSDNIHHPYHSTLGTICVVPRHRLSGYKAQDGKPVTVTYPGYGYPDKDYLDILGIKVCDYQYLKPALVVFELADGSLLAATKEVLEASMRGDSYAWAGHISINPRVKDLQILQDLPEPLIEADGIPVYSFG